MQPLTDRGACRSGWDIIWAGRWQTRGALRSSRPDRSPRDVVITAAACPWAISLSASRSSRSSPRSVSPCSMKRESVQLATQSTPDLHCWQSVHLSRFECSVDPRAEHAGATEVIALGPAYGGSRLQRRRSCFKGYRSVSTPMDICSLDNRTQASSRLAALVGVNALLWTAWPILAGRSRVEAILVGPLLPA